MKKTRQAFWALVRLAVGIGIVAFLVRNVSRSSWLVEFEIPAASVPADSVYTNAYGHFIVLEPVLEGTQLTALAKLNKPGDPIPESGELARAAGGGPQALSWSGVDARPYGLQMLGRSFRETLRNWPLLALGIVTFFGCLLLCMARWRLLLLAQGLELSWGQTWSILFIGHFFNAFMFGATGGDVVKAYYAAKQTGHKKTEAVSTVFIDRVMGLAALIILAAAVMLFRLRFFLSEEPLRYALAFIGILAVGAVLGFASMFCMRGLMTRSRLFRRVLETGVGHQFYRAYESFYVCLTHPALLLKTFALSLANHLLLVVMMYCLGLALSIELGFVAYLTVGPTINTIGAIPVTPGGLGLREYAAVTYLGVLGVAAAQALPLSLLIYATMLFWSLFGGVVFLFYTSGSDRSLRDELREASAEQEPAATHRPR